MSKGLDLAGSNKLGKFKCVAAIDNWNSACKTFTRNFEIDALCKPVSENVIKDVLGKTGDVDIVVGGPPCQGFSTSGKRALDDPRNTLIRTFMQAIKIAKPKAFIMENVKGFSNFQNGRTMLEVISIAKEMGYNVFPGLVLASLCGVPQRRKRFLLIGISSGIFNFPGSNQGPSDIKVIQETMFEYCPNDRDLIIDQSPEDGNEKWSFLDATSDLPLIEAGSFSNEYASPPRNDFQKWARSDSDCELTEHITVNHNTKFIEMMSYIPEGKSALSPDINKLIPPEIRPRSGFPNSYSRITGNKPAPTITRNFTTPSSANCIHPLVNRALSIREGARCQSFNDGFVFEGTLTDKRLQIGNAVPPLLAKSVGEELLKSLNG